MKLFIHLAIFFFVLFELKELARNKKPGKSFSIKKNQKSNLNRQSAGFSREIDNRLNALSRISNERLIGELERTFEDGFNRRDPEASRLGLHSMKRNTLLAGYFTIDVPQDKNDNSPGNARLLLKATVTKGMIKQIDVFGVVDTHGPDNVKLWNDIPDDDRSSYIMVKNDRNMLIGVKAVNTDD